MLTSPSSLLLDHLRQQRQLLESGDWQGAAENEKPEEMAGWLQEVFASPEAIALEERRQIAAEIGLIIAAGERLRDDARDKIAAALPHQKHLQRLLSDLSTARSRVISEA